MHIYLITLNAIVELLHLKTRCMLHIIQGHHYALIRMDGSLHSYQLALIVSVYSSKNVIEDCNSVLNARLCA